MVGCEFVATGTGVGCAALTPLSVLMAVAVVARGSCCAAHAALPATMAAATGARTAADVHRAEDLVIGAAASLTATVARTVAPAVIPATAPVVAGSA